MYQEFVSPALIQHLRRFMQPVRGVEGLEHIGAQGGLETNEALQFLCDLHDEVVGELCTVLQQRVQDRAFMDQRTLACFHMNRALHIDFRDPDYRTILGETDASGRVVMGPLCEGYFRKGGGPMVAPIPEFLQGHHVTLFGPPDDAKLSLNAMNAFHRKLKGEPEIVEALLRGTNHSPMWGADDEDSKTPLRRDLIQAGENLAGCLRGTLAYADPHSGKQYSLASDHRSLPIKRFPGLAMPCPFLFRHGVPMPLHLYDFALHVFAHWHDAKSLVMYVPKLENEEEAAYVHLMVQHAERLLQKRFPTYVAGSIRLLIVLENPRAIFRLNEMMDALHPYFAGASLGWHDFLASTARVMKHDSNYRIPVKADPNIVIKHIKASHDLLATVVGSRGGIKIGGMYGVLPMDNSMESASFQVAMVGFIKDVVIQLKRDLSGFWVAHPDFVRIGLALVEAWKRLLAGEAAPMDSLVKSLLLPQHHASVLAFIHGKDVDGLKVQDPLYARALIAADAKASDFRANNDPEEIRYNIFQTLQYLADWLSGHGCVALPTAIDGVPVRVMDDLATAERSRWEVWHELHHGRISVQDFVRMAHEEMHFIQKDVASDHKIVQVKWNEQSRRWYPIAFHLMLQLMSRDTPVEFASELLLPFTLDSIRDHADPLQCIMAIEPEKYALPDKVARCHAYFSACGSRAFVEAMADCAVMDLAAVERAIMGLTESDVVEAARFHGDIGERSESLDNTATQEQSRLAADGERTREELMVLGQEYCKKFKVKFLTSAHGKTGSELLSALRSRLSNSSTEELQHAREALWQIAKRRLQANPLDTVAERMEAARKRHGICGASICILEPHGGNQSLVLGDRGDGQAVTPTTRFQIASLSKSVATCMAMEHFQKTGAPLSSKVNHLLSQTSSQFRIRSLQDGKPEWADQVTVEHLMRHQAMNMHYVQGVAASKAIPALADLLQGNAECGYEATAVLHEPGTKFQYSGGGFMVLEHLLVSREKSPIEAMVKDFVQAMGVHHTVCTQRDPQDSDCSLGMIESKPACGSLRKVFPACAAGLEATACDVGRFLSTLTRAFHDSAGAGPISHDTAVRMLHASDFGSQEFMGCNMGLGIFTAEAGANRLCIHQGANDGFRALCIHCYAGPDCGKGMVVLCNAEQNGVAFISEVAQVLLGHFRMQGIDASQFRSTMSTESVPLHERVNAGYRDLIFGAFQADAPEAILQRGPLDPHSEFNLVSGARIVAVSNQRFARAENLLSSFQPMFDPLLYGRQGKIMDSWESVRHNPSACDWMIFEMQAASDIDCVTVSTQFHQGNHAPAIRVEGWCQQQNAWLDILPTSKLMGHAIHTFQAVSGTTSFQRIRVSNIPDGGITRLGLYGRRLPAKDKASMTARHMQEFPPMDTAQHKPMTPHFSPTSQQIQWNFARCQSKPVDVACAAFGGRIVSVTNQHYGPAAQVISPFPPIHMFDGLESARSRAPDHHEHVVIALGQPVQIGRIEIDFTYFVNNNPRELRIDGFSDGAWVPLMPQTQVKAYAGNVLVVPVHAPCVCSQVRVTCIPDGGMNRIRVYDSTARDRP